MTNGTQVSLQSFGLKSPHDGEFACGSVAGHLHLPDVLRDGHDVGRMAAASVGATASTGAHPDGEGDAPPAVKPYWWAPAPRRAEKRQFVDLQNDVTVADIRLSLDEGFEHIEHVKRYTALGFGTDQGRTSATLGAAILASLKGEDLPGVGLFRLRPPYHPVSLQSLAGLHSGHADPVLSHFEHYLAAEGWSSRVTLTNVTDAWAVIVAAGSGELGFEIHCHPAVARTVWEQLQRAGLEPYGVEALDILRIEKGYLVSAEINGQTTPYDLGLGSLAKASTNSIGRDLLDRPAFLDESRPRLVGLRSADGRTRFLGGSQFTRTPNDNICCGHVTSSCFSPTVGEWIGLGLLARDASAEGSLVIARDPLRDGKIPVRVVSPVHWDPSGARMKQ